MSQQGARLSTKAGSIGGAVRVQQVLLSPSAMADDGNGNVVRALAG
jgi:hypothetical protein